MGRDKNKSPLKSRTSRERPLRKFSPPDGKKKTKHQRVQSSVRYPGRERVDENKKPARFKCLAPRTGLRSFTKTNQNSKLRQGEQQKTWKMQTNGISPQCNNEYASQFNEEEKMKGIPFRNKAKVTGETIAEGSGPN